MLNKKLLLEIGTEDLPSRNLNNLSEELKKNIEYLFKKNNIKYSFIENYFTNIRLIFIFYDLEREVFIEEKYIKGPLVSKCYDEVNKLTNVGLGFLQKYKVKIELLEKKTFDDKEYFFYRQPKISLKIEEIFPKILEESLELIENQKKMKWGNSNFLFIRPIRWILLFYDDNYISSNIFGTKTCNYTYGNKSISNKKFHIKNISEYFKFLKKESIEINFIERVKLITQEYKKIIFKNKFDNLIDLDFLNEVANMVEFPYLYIGSFPKKYLNLPHEVLKYVIQDSQKYFVLYKNGKIINYFIGVSNVEINKGIIQGNERVIRPRLDDAQFFISKDLSNNIFEKKSLLDKVIFHKKLGSISEKVQRIVELSSYLNSKSHNDENHFYKKIAEVCKIDLISNMVVEIPKLQGYIGSYYASKLNMDNIVSSGIREHYAPRNPEDDLPSDISSQIVSIADKVDTIVGIFLVNEKPTGTRDPIGIRRSTNGVLRMILQMDYNISLTELINKAYEVISSKFSLLKDNKKSLSDCHIFLKEKLISLLKDNYGFEENIIFSVINNSKNIIPKDILRKINAISKIRNNQSYNELFSNAKRVSNILKKSDFKLPEKINKNLLKEFSEKELYNGVNEIKKELQLFLDTYNYIEYLKKMNTLNNYIEHFFQEVMINTDDEDIKLNRLSLLYEINKYYNKVANFSILIH